MKIITVGRDILESGIQYRVSLLFLIEMSNIVLLKKQIISEVAIFTDTAL